MRSALRPPRACMAASCPRSPSASLLPSLHARSRQSRAAPDLRDGPMADPRSLNAAPKWSQPMTARFGFRRTQGNSLPSLFAPAMPAPLEYAPSHVLGRCASAQRKSPLFPNFFPWNTFGVFLWGRPQNGDRKISRMSRQFFFVSSVPMISSSSMAAAAGAWLGAAGGAAVGTPCSKLVLGGICRSAWGVNCACGGALLLEVCPFCPALRPLPLVCNPSPCIARAESAGTPLALPPSLALAPWPSLELGLALGLALALAFALALSSPPPWSEAGTDTTIWAASLVSSASSPLPAPGIATSPPPPLLLF